MYHLRSDTLAGIRLSALFDKRDLSGVEVPDAVASLNGYMSSAQMVKPEGEAFKFYVANHVMSVIASKFDPNEPLPKEVESLARGYVKLSSDVAVRLAYYCLLITTREARHMYKNESVIQSISNQCGAAVGKFIKANQGHGEMEAVNRLRNSPPSTLLGNYTKGMVLAFMEGGYSHSYGGPAWGKIAETLHRMVIGEFSPEMFADTAFTLAHNTGPIFNKGMLYHGYGTFLYKLLDVQRSGQMPQLYPEVPSPLISSETKVFVEEARLVFPQEMSGYVDWFKVEALGALHKYPGEQQKQLAEHGPSAFVSAKQKENAKKYFVGMGNNDYAEVYVREEIA